MSSSELLLYPSGALYGKIREDKREYYYENGALKTVESYREGRLDGEVLLYWPNSNIKRKCFFILGLREGVDQIWSEEGLLLDESFYIKGKAQGVHRRWNRHGVLIEEIVYLESNRFDLRRWDELGELRVEALWIDATNYKEKVWDRFQNIWVEKIGRWDGKKLVYI
jgi:antitoxin component YwqK of YwqJK toxin-antitoxin module